MAEALHLVGGSIACLVAALRAGQHGRPVTLHADPARLGASFAGIMLEGRRLNLGIRVFELEHEAAGDQPVPGCDLARDDHLPFLGSIRALVEEVLGEELVRAAAPEMWLEGRRAPCVLTNADIAALPPLLDPARRSRIAREAAALLEAPSPPPCRFRPGHPAGAVRAALEETPLEEASLANHGATLHGLLIPAVAARLDPGWASRVAAARRKLWLALFHPRTVLEAFRGETPGFRPHRPFWGMRGGVSAVFVERLLTLLTALPSVRINPVGRLRHMASGPRGTVLLDFAAPPGGAPQRLSLPAATCALGLGAEELFRAAGVDYAPQRLSVAFGWAEVAEADLRHCPFSLLLAAPGAPALRVSAGPVAEGGRRVMALEFGHVPEGLPHPGAAEARRALEETGLLREGAPMRLLGVTSLPCLQVPSFDNRRAFQAALAAFHARGPEGWAGQLLCGAGRLGFDSMNEQILTGLRIGEP
ncbi:hypothetical protein [Teichococcus aestuarii]|uniref:hypothetical protein n=1 Tax=Teichococcus aestuarii TaxID=568898 RepID=UPI003618576E